MPYIAFDGSGCEWADSDSLSCPKKLSDFEFLPAPFVARSTEVVRFDKDGNLISEPNPTLAAAFEAQRQMPMDTQSQNRFALLLPCMRDIGLEKVYCRVDGGHDDSFSWVSHGFLSSGQHVGVDALCDQLASSEMFTLELRLLLSWENDLRSDVTVIRDTLDVDVCSLMWAPWLFGLTLGAGSYSFFGAYIVDLVEGTIEEDPDADPVVQNISIAFS